MSELTTEQVQWRAKWVKALLSGDYEQGHGALCTRPGPRSDQRDYCCLGVAAHIVDPDFPGLLFLKGNNGPTESDSGTLDGPMCAVFGLDDETEDQESLYQLNDDDHWTFEQIARGVAYATSEGFPVQHLRRWFNEEQEEEVDATQVPEDFDAGAWADGVLAS